jgi:hypothetical protein
LEKLSVRDKYNGQDQMHTANGAGMRINNIGHTILHTPKRDLHLKNILNVPSAHKNLVSVHRLTSDNNTFLEFHPNFFLIKDQVSKKILHHGRCRGGLYPLLPRGAASDKQVLGVVKPTTSRWHSRLGHPSLPIVQRVLRDNNLPFVSYLEVESVRDACQKAKSHQLPYSRSHSISSAPL